MHSSQNLEQAIAEDLRTHELGLRVEVIDDRVIVRGEVASDERRAAVMDVLRECRPDSTLVDCLRISDATEPPARTERVDPA